MPIMTFVIPGVIAPAASLRHIRQRNPPSPVPVSGYLLRSTSAESCSVDPRLWHQGALISGSKPTSRALTSVSSGANRASLSRLMGIRSPEGEVDLGPKRRPEAMLPQAKLDDKGIWYRIILSWNQIIHPYGGSRQTEQTTVHGLTCPSSLSSRCNVPTAPARPSTSSPGEPLSQDTI